jgi:bifunctional N-acetylglucosamine-1-phosphate-uridyltransferase/glucosamine-1-phosphate-acetyltransferase GlmU-like protein
MKRRVLVIPAAGRGSRLGADVPKLLVEVGGRSMAQHLLDLYREYVERVVLVVSPDGHAPVSNHLAGRSEAISLALQPEPTGMLDAILLAMPLLRDDPPEWIWITWCDQIAIMPRTVAALAAACDGAGGAAMVVATIERSDPYIHLERDAAGCIQRILHAREGDDMPERGESDMGLFALSSRAYFELLPLYANAAGPASATRERNFLPFIGWLRGRAEVLTISGCDPMESVGINTPDELERVEAFVGRG